ncbi:dihydroflavonol-4-reductase [Asanoa ferruginea]|nr:dihydroflavonol-4-reductase [Asanoa ferruginea]
MTGGSGFLGAYAVASALRAGHQVRTTVRSLARELDVRAMVTAAGVDPGPALEVVPADLTADDGWAEAMAGCTGVLHIAAPADLAELVGPARDGAVRVLRAARDAGVARVVLTSTFGAIAYGRKATEQPFTEADWTDPHAPGLEPYVVAKTLAERAAWDFVAREGGGLELVVINPTSVFGPVLDINPSNSIGLVRAMLSGAMPRVPDIWITPVDVRDVADLHVRAIDLPGAGGERFIAAGDTLMSMRDVAKLLRGRLGRDAARVSTRPLWTPLVRATALAVPTMRGLAGNVGVRRRADNTKARQAFDWTPRDAEDTLVDTARSLIAFGAV